MPSAAEGNDTLKIIEIVTGVLVAVIGLFTAYHCTCRRFGFWYQRSGNTQDDKSDSSETYKKKEENMYRSSTDEDGSLRIKRGAKKKSMYDDSDSNSDSRSDEDTWQRQGLKRRHKSKKSRIRKSKSKRREYSSDESDDDKKKNKSCHDSSSTDEDGSQRIKKRSKKKWSFTLCYFSEEDDSDSYYTRKGKESKKKSRSRKSKSKRREYSSDESDDDDDDKKENKSRHDSLSNYEDGSQRIKFEEDDSDLFLVSYSRSDNDTRKGTDPKKRPKSIKSRRSGKSNRREYSSNECNDDDDKKKKGKRRSDKSDIDGYYQFYKYFQLITLLASLLYNSQGNSGSMNLVENIVRKEMGLEGMLRPKEDDVKPKSVTASHLPANEIKKVNPRELNPYFRNDGSGYPEEEGDGAKSRDSNLLSTSIVGDGGASWGLKALKRSQEQAAREGKDVDEVVKQRCGSLGKLAVSVASNSAAPSHAHLHAIKNRIRQQNRDQPGDQNETEREDSQKGMHTKMRVPRRDESLSWGKRRGDQSMSVKDAGVISSALSSLQKFSNDGSFLHQFKGLRQQKNDDSSSTDGGDRRDSKSEEPSSCADKPLKEAEVNEGKSKTDTVRSNLQGDGTASRYIMHDLKSREKNREEDADMHVARSIMQNKKFSISGEADDEYDNDEGPKRKKWGKGDNNAAPKPARFGKRILTQQKIPCNMEEQSISMLSILPFEKLRGMEKSS